MAYTTGELAKACDVSVRTIQYYDQKQLLKPSQIANGRRYYHEQDKLRLEMIITLKRMNFSLKEINVLLEAPGSIKTLKFLMQRKEAELVQKIQIEQAQLAQIKSLNIAMSQNSEEPITNILKFDEISEGMNGMKKFRRNLMLSAGVVGVVQYGSIIASIINHDWKPIGIAAPFLVAYGIGVTWIFYKHVSYVCPNCQHIFKPSLSAMIVANHTFKTRKLQCPACHETHYCVEVLDQHDNPETREV